MNKKPKENFTVRVDHETKNGLRNMDPNSIREFLNILAKNYDKYIGSSEQLMLEMAIEYDNRKLEFIEEFKERVKAHKKGLLEELEEARQVQHKEEEALIVVWNDLCKMVNMQEDTKGYDYVDVNRVFQNSLMCNDAIISFCKNKLRRLITPLEEIQNRSPTDATTLKKWKYLMKQIERIEETPFINGVEYKNNNKAGSGNNGNHK